jgi:benzoyl-CoA reductase/2-hydroxyglutaryl-CoA dehydratase subunit BcrC/BadD/HgdB
MASQSTMNVFKDLLESPQNSLVEQAVADGRIPIAYCCSFVPEAILMADRLFPVIARAPGVAGTEIADNYLSLFLCSYTRSILEFAVDDRFDLMRGWVHVPSCAHMQRFLDNLEYLKKPAFSHVIDTPRKSATISIDWQVKELRRLTDKLSSHFGVDMSDASLMKAIGEFNNYAETVRAIGDLRKRPNPPITGTEFHTMYMAALASPKDLILPKIREFHTEIEQRESTKKFRARLMLIGGHLHDAELIGAIESQGGLVVADRFCSGSIPGAMPIVVNGDPIRSLAEHTFKKTLCPRMMADLQLRIQTCVDTVKEYKCDGVVVETIKFCDLWGINAMLLVMALRERGIPVLRLEREYRLSGEGQIATRVQAFIESLGK